MTDVQLDQLLSREYADERRPLISDEASGELRPGARPPAAARGDAKPWARGRGADARRHRSSRRGRPVREPDLGDAERRLAAELADDPAARLAARHARADVLARGGTAVVARAGQAAAHDAVAGARAARREPWLAYGTPGGDQQEQWALHVLVRHVDRGLGLQEAIDAPEWHTDHLISSFYPRGFEARSLAVESRLGEPAIADLRRRGHNVTVAEPWSLGRVSAVARGRTSSTPPRMRAGCRGTRSRGERGQGRLVQASARVAWPPVSEMQPRYEPRGVEERWQETWEAEGLYNADPDPARTPYVDAHPPPNVTGELHMGTRCSSRSATPIIRMKRMQGFNTLFQPGYDHAGISTQNVVEKRAARRRHVAAGARPRGVRGARLGVAARVRRQDPRPVPAHGRVARLPAHALHDGRRSTSEP